MSFHIVTLSLITHPHVILSPKDLRSFSEDVFELSDPPIDTDSKDPNTIKAQKRSKDIVKLIHVTSVVQSSFYESMRIFCVQRKLKNYFIQQSASSLSLYSAILESMTYLTTYATNVHGYVVCCHISVPRSW